MGVFKYFFLLFIVLFFSSNSYCAGFVIEALGAPLHYSTLKTEGATEKAAYEGMSYQVRAGYHIDPMLGLYLTYLMGTHKNKNNTASVTEKKADSEIGVAIKSYFYHPLYLLLGYGQITSKLKHSGDYTETNKLKGTRTYLGLGLSKLFTDGSGFKLFGSIEYCYTLSSSYNKYDDQELTDKIREPGTTLCLLLDSQYKEKFMLKNNILLVYLFLYLALSFSCGKGDGPFIESDSDSPGTESTTYYSCYKPNWNGCFDLCLDYTGVTWTAATAEIDCDGRTYTFQTQSCITSGVTPVSFFGTCTDNDPLEFKYRYPRDPESPDCGLGDAATICTGAILNADTWTPE